MIQNFNFYDVYGYFLPGFTLLLMFWLPFGITTRSWPVAALASAVFAVAVAYIAGHILQIFASHVFPPKLKGRYPSDLVLNQNDQTFTDLFKGPLKNRIKLICGLDVDHGPEDQDLDEKEEELRSRVRGDAFFVCRSLLSQAKSMTYAEQSQGMYALMVGLALAFGLGSLYQLGWSSSSWIRDSLELYVSIGIVVTLMFAIVVVSVTVNLEDPRKSTGFRVALISLVITVFLLGGLLGSRRATEEGRALFLIIGLTSLLASVTCYNGYKFFIREYAKAVYYAFSTYEKTKRPNSSNCPQKS
ncbi:MAG: hypothetical protein QOG23_3466 [Blastocatellia bacterium]|jgi:hypothetical protein|nr:hypothetical protein [Blastocatellia bacterium]